MKPFTAIAVLVFLLIAILQLLRFTLRWEVTVNGVTVPVWLSGIAFVIMAGLAVMVWRGARRWRCQGDGPVLASAPGSFGEDEVAPVSPRGVIRPPPGPGGKRVTAPP